MEAFSTWQIVSLVSIFGWILIARVFNLTVHVRNFVRPFVLHRVDKGASWVLLVQTFIHPVLDKFFCFMSCIVSVPFYTTFLPLLFWSGHYKLGRQMTLLMAFCNYTGNCIKDIVSAPRPLSPSIRRLTTTKDEKENAMEYGFPSSHTLNTICLAGYLLHYTINSFDINDAAVQFFCVSLFLILVFLIGIGRIYLGMHSPIDILGGGGLGVMILIFWLSFDQNIDDFVTSGKNVIYFWTSLAFLLLFAYPTPELPTPSFDFHVAFNGVALGVVSGINRTFSDFHHENVPKLFGSHLSMVTFIKRVMVGLPIIIGVKVVSKALAKWFLPLIYNVMGIPIKSTNYIKPTKDSGIEEPYYFGQLSVSNRQSSYLHKLFLTSPDDCYDVDTGIKLLQYAGLSWAVVELVPMVFQSLGL